MEKLSTMQDAILFVKAGMWGDDGDQCRRIKMDRSTIDYLKKNRISLGYLRARNGQLGNVINASSEARAQLQLEEVTVLKNRMAFLEVNSKMVARGIQTVLIKSVGFFPGETSNIDVLVEDQNVAKAASILRGLGYLQQRRYVRPDKFLWGRFVGCEKKDLVHLHTRVSWGPPFIDVAQLWKRKVRLDGFGWRPCNEHGFLITIASKFYEDSKFDLLDILKLHLCQPDTLDWNFLLAEVERYGWLPGLALSALLLDEFNSLHFPEHRLLPLVVRDKLVQCLSARDGTLLYWRTNCSRIKKEDLPFVINKTFTKSHAYLASIRASVVPWKNKLRDMGLLSKWAFESLFGLRDRRRFLLVLSGPDGAGKSSFAEDARMALRATGEQPEVVWIRIGDSCFLNFLKKFCQRGYSQPGSGSIGAASQDGLLGGRSMRVLWLWLASFDFILRVWLKVGLKLLRKRVVICDRYLADAVDDLSYRCGWECVEGSVPYKLLVRFTPKPDLTFFLLASEGTIKSRRPVINTATLQRSLVNYRKLTARFDRVTVIKTDDITVQDKTSYVVQVVDNYYEKY